MSFIFIKFIYVKVTNSFMFCLFKLDLLIVLLSQLLYDMRTNNLIAIFIDLLVDFLVGLLVDLLSD
jgi:hypothetical protein